MLPASPRASGMDLVEKSAGPASRRDGGRSSPRLWHPATCLFSHSPSQETCLIGDLPFREDGYQLFLGLVVFTLKTNHCDINFRK